MTSRIVRRTRKTTETDIRLELNLDGTGEASVKTGVGFFDHMLTAFARHGRMDLTCECVGDLNVDDHHTVEDCSLVLGGAIDEALGERRGIERFGDAMVPMDESLARAVVDLSGRPYACVNLDLLGIRIGDCSSGNLDHAIESLAFAARATVHVDVLRGRNDHHKAEAAFKALALALRQAVRLSGGDRIPSTKEVL